MLQVLVFVLLLSTQSAPRHCSDPPPPPVCSVDQEGGLVCFPADEPECIPDDPAIPPATDPPPCDLGMNDQSSLQCSQQ